MTERRPPGDSSLAALMRARLARIASSSAGPLLWAYGSLTLIGLVVAAVVWAQIDAAAPGENVRWANRRALALLAGCALVAWTGLHLRQTRSATLAFSRVADARAVRRRWIAQLSALPVVLRMAFSLPPSTWETLWGNSTPCPQTKESPITATVYGRGVSTPNTCRSVCLSPG